MLPTALGQVSNLPQLEGKRHSPSGQTQRGRLVPCQSKQSALLLLPTLEMLVVPVFN